MPDYNTDLSAERARELLNYDSKTGVIKWKESRGRARTGDVAGYIEDTNTQDNLRKDEYRLIRVDGTSYRAHRLAFLIQTGRWPDEEIDHINGDGTDNEWSNLREVTRAENCRNRAKSCNNSSGYMGVYWNKECEKWRAQIRVNGTLKSLGYFDEKSDAIKARKRAEEEYVFHENHGRHN